MNVHPSHTIYNHHHGTHRKHSTLHAEFRATITVEAHKRLSEQGVTVRNIIDIGLVGLQCVRFDGPWYEPDSDGVNAWICPVFHYVKHTPCYETDLLDLVAFAGNKIGRRDKHALCLGQHWLDQFLVDDCLKVFQHPMDWLTAGGDGIFILDRAQAWDRLRHIGRLLAMGGVSHGHELDRLMRAPEYRGKILVMEAAE